MNSASLPRARDFGRLGGPAAGVAFREVNFGPGIGEPSAIAAPIPEPAPLTTAILPVSSNMPPSRARARRGRCCIVAAAIAEVFSDFRCGWGDSCGRMPRALTGTPRWGTRYEAKDFDR